MRHLTVALLSMGSALLLVALTATDVPPVVVGLGGFALGVPLGAMIARGNYLTLLRAYEPDQRHTRPPKGGMQRPGPLAGDVPRAPHAKRIPAERP